MREVEEETRTAAIRGLAFRLPLERTVCVCKPVCMCHFRAGHTVRLAQHDKALIYWMVNGAVHMLTVAPRKAFIVKIQASLCSLSLSLCSAPPSLLFFSVSSPTTLISSFSLQCVIPRCPPSFLFLFCTAQFQQCKHAYNSLFLPSPLSPRSPVTVDDSVGQCHQCFGHTEGSGLQNQEC